MDDLTRAGLRAADQDRLLPGEREGLATSHEDDAAHWTQVYSELSEFKRGLLDSIEQKRNRTQSEAAIELDNDLVLMRAELRRLDGRLGYWNERLRSLRNGGSP
jgi:hypothetical protein